MKIVYTDSFFKSLRKMIMHEKWYYKTWEFFRYKLPGFVSNIWKFRKELYRHRGWDSGYSMEMLKRSLQILADSIERYGNEIDGPRLKKVAAIRRAVEILTNITEDRYIGLAEAALGREVDCSKMFSETEGASEIDRLNSEIFDMAGDLEKREWLELFKILQGQNHAQYVALYEASSKEETDQRDLWHEWFDGTGMKSWWN